MVDSGNGGSKLKLPGDMDVCLSVCLPRTTLTHRPPGLPPTRTYASQPIHSHLLNTHTVKRPWKLSLLAGSGSPSTPAIAPIETCPWLLL